MRNISRIPDFRRLMLFPGDSNGRVPCNWKCKKNNYLGEEEILPKSVGYKVWHRMVELGRELRLARGGQ